MEWTSNRNDKSHVEAIGHDAETKELGVRYRNGGVYHYANWTPEKHEALSAAESWGVHLHRNVIGAKGDDGQPLHPHTKQRPVM
jgi:hypothetical protein